MAEKQEGFITEYAGFWMRLGAYLIDAIILSAVSSILFFIPYTFIFAGFAAWGEEAAGLAIAIFWIGWLISLAVEVLYFVCFWQWRGQTPGKMALGIKIIKTDGSTLTWGSALIRFLGYIVSTIILCIGFIWIAFDGRKQGIHDKIAETYVIILPRKRVILPETYEAG